MNETLSSNDSAPKPSTCGTRATLWAALFAAGVCALTPLPFLPSLSNGFVNWDDPGLILENVHIQSLGWKQLSWMFTSFHMGPYEPIPLLSLALDYSIWGPDARGFHLSSMLWHTANALSFYVLVRRLLIAAIPAAASRPLLLGLCSTISAVIFSMHPLRVESVAWAAGRLDLVAAFFGLWTVWSYTKAVGIDSRQCSTIRWLTVSLIFYALSLLSKSSTLLLPAVLSVLDFYPLGRLSRSRWRTSDPVARGIWLEKLPFWMLSVVAAGVALYGRYVAGAVAPLAAYGLIDRIALVGFSSAFYAWKTLLPLRLSPLYELPDDISILEPRFLAGIGATLLATALVVRHRHRAPAALAAWVVYLILLLPASGLTQTGAQLAADRYSYLPCLSFAVLLGGLCLRWPLAIANSTRAMGVSAALLVASLVLGALSWHQTKIWRNSQTLWQSALRIDPASSKALTGLACAVAEEGALAQARTLLEEATQLRPRSHYAHWNLGLVLYRLGERELAVQHYMEAWRWSPHSFDIAQAMGSLYQENGDWPNAAHWYERALARRPNEPKTLTGLGTVRAALGELDRAVALLQRAIQIDPGNSIAHNSLGIAFRRLGKTDLALEQFVIARRLDPGSADICYNLGYLFMYTEDWPSAIEWYERALSIDPKLVKAINDMGIVHKKQGQIDRAVELYREALKVDPNSTEPRYNLALALAEGGEAEGAIAEYERVLQLDSAHVSAAHNLAMLLVGRHSFSRAANVLETAVNVTNHPALMQRLSWLLATAPEPDVRDGPEAVRLAEHLAERTQANAQVLDTLAAAYAEAGIFNLAVEAASRAIQLASQNETSDLADEIRARRELYRAGQAYRSE
jgi:Flp pilus assembly protein TadD